MNEICSKTGDMSFVCNLMFSVFLVSNHHKLVSREKKTPKDTESIAKTETAQTMFRPIQTIIIWRQPQPVMSTT